jgi:hypothetical protein
LVKAVFLAMPVPDFEHKNLNPMIRLAISLAIENVINRSIVYYHHFPLV